MESSATSSARVGPTTALSRLWFVVGVAFAAFLMATQAAALGGLGGLLLVGETSALRPYVESVLPGVPLTEGVGHDGQIYFAIANDLEGVEVAQFIENPGIRFRRPVLPFLASFGGLLSGESVLWATAGWIGVGTGLAAMAFRGLLQRLGSSPMWMLALFAYPGFWLGVRLFTPDMIALGTALTGLFLLVDRKGSIAWPIILMTVSVLSKEAFLIIPLAAAATWFLAGLRTRGVLLAAVPCAALFARVLIVLDRFEVQVVDGNFGLPFTGILEARSFWPTTPVSDQVWVYLTMALLLTSVAGLRFARSTLVRLLIIPWPILAIISSAWIWRVGNGLLRSFAPLLLFIALAIAEHMTGRPLSTPGSRPPNMAKSSS